MLTTTVTHSHRAMPIADWYTLPAWDTSSLVAEAIKEFGVPEGGTVLDPFCGAGDGLLAAKLAGRNGLGIEANPFLQFAAHAKTRAYTLPQLRLETERLLEEAKGALDKVDSDGDLQWRLAGRMPQMPRLQSWIANRVAWKIVALQECIERCVGEENRDLPTLALASVLRGASHMKLSPHAYGSRDSKPYTPVLYHFDAKLRKMLADLEWAEEQEGLGKIMVLDGQQTNQQLAARSPQPLASLAVTAPPPLSEFDPTLQTRLELFFLGYVGSMTELEGLRADISFQEPVKGAPRASELASVKQVSEAMDAKPGDGGDVARNYFENLLLSLETMREMLAPQAPIVLALGECVLSGVQVPVPDIAAELGQLGGYERTQVRVLRTLRHKGVKGGLKECVVVLRR